MSEYRHALFIRILAATCCALLCLSMIPTTALAEEGASEPGTIAHEGFYIGMGIGGAVVFGDDRVAFKEQPQDKGVTTSFPCLNKSKYPNNDCARTDFGQGLAAMIRLGYNIRGAVAIEAAILAHGTNLGADTQEGSGHTNFNLVLHPLGIATLADPDLHFEPKWDPYVLIGGGFSYGGYESNFDNDTKGWFAADLQTGLGLNAYVTEHVAISADLRWTIPMYSTFIYDWGKDLNYDLKDDTSSVIMTPMALISYHP